jgi:hypothetical protein
VIDALIHLLDPFFPCQVDPSPDSYSLDLNHLLPPVFDDIVRCLQAGEQVRLILAIYQVSCMGEDLSNVVIVKTFDFLVFGEGIVEEVHHYAGVFNHTDGV